MYWVESSAKDTDALDLITDHEISSDELDIFVDSGSSTHERLMISRTPRT
jgi:hypothetical protein